MLLSLATILALSHVGARGRWLGGAGTSACPLTARRAEADNFISLRMCTCCGGGRGGVDRLSTCTGEGGPEKRNELFGMHPSLWRGEGFWAQRLVLTLTPRGPGAAYLAS